MGRCPSIEPPAFVHRCIGTLQPPWPEGRLLSLPTRPFLAEPREGLRQGTSPRGGLENPLQLCFQCQLKELVRDKTKNPMIITDTPGTAFEKISMDIVGKFPITSLQNQYILTIQDNLSKYFLAIPFPNHQAGTIADAFVKKFTCIHGSLKALLTDQGADFQSNLMRKMVKRS